MEKRTRRDFHRWRLKSTCHTGENWREKDQLELVKEILYDTEHFTDTRGVRWVIHSFSVSVKWVVLLLVSRINGSVMAAGCIEYHNLSWMHKHYFRNELKFFFSCLKMVLALMMKTREGEEANQCAFANICLLIDCSQVSETNKRIAIPRYCQLCWLGLYRSHMHASLPFLVPSSFTLVFCAVSHAHWGSSGNLWVIPHGSFTSIPRPPV